MVNDYPSFCVFFFFNDTATTEIYTLSLHDALPICRLTLNLGLRWDYYAGVAFNQNYSPTYRFLQSVLPSFHGKQMSTPATNFGPRVGFVYQLTGDGNTVLRGGYGFYFNFPILTTFYTLDERNSNPLRLGYFVNDPNGIKNSDGSSYQYGQPLPPNQIASTAAALPDSV